MGRRKARRRGRVDGPYSTRPGNGPGQGGDTAIGYTEYILSLVELIDFLCELSPHIIIIYKVVLVMGKC